MTQKNSRINTEILTNSYLNKYNLNIEEFLILYAIHLQKGSDFNKVFSSLMNKQLIKNIVPLQNKIAANDVFLLTENGKTLLLDTLANTTTLDNTSIEKLALEMKQLFPKGSKTQGHPWRSNTKEVVDKLKRFKISYNYTDEEILEATKNYIEVMKDSPYMRTLKHFIIKKVNDEIVSDLASFIENDQQTIYARFDIIYRPDSTDNSSNFPNQLELF